jgi:hypothetical protein
MSLASTQFVAAPPSFQAGAAGATTIQHAAAAGAAAAAASGDDSGGAPAADCQQHMEGLANATNSTNAASAFEEEWRVMSIR